MNRETPKRFGALSSTSADLEMDKDNSGYGDDEFVTVLMDDSVIDESIL